MRKFRLVSLVMMLSAQVACSGPQAEVVKSEAPKFVDRPAKAGRVPILVLTPYAQSAHDMWSSMRDEVSDDMDVVTMEMREGVSVEDVKMRLEHVQPKCVVLLGNQAVRTFRAVQKEVPETPPVVVAMSSFAKQLAGDLRNATGVAYEVPAVTSFVTLRQLSSRSIDKVGVVYRPAFKSFVGAQAELAEMERVHLVGRSLEGEVGARRIRLALHELLRSEKVDAIWVLNDNALLDPKTIRDGWLPEARKSQVPIIVGVSSLVDPRLSFGSIAVVPDHAALGVQVANLLFELSDEDWVVNDREIELPLSVETVVDMNQSHIIDLVDGAPEMIDRQVSEAPSPLYF
jgi:hypothetical protein